MDSISPPDRPHYPWKRGEILIADELNAAIANAGHGTRVTDWIPGGQPDGVTDLAVYFQAAIDDAADADPADRASAPGLTRLIVPANPLPYVIGTSLYVPSHTHLVIEHGATLKLAPQTNAHMFVLVCFAHHVLLELYGTLDGNSSQQYFKPNSATFPPATDISATSISGGITNQTIWGGPARNPIVQGGMCSHVRVIGDRNGLITNFQNWPVGFGGTTNVEVSGISMTNSAFRAGSIAFNGWRNFPYDPAVGTPLTFTGTYAAATNTVTLTTSVPHCMVPGEEFITESVTGSSGSYNCATGKLFITLPGTAGNTIVYSGTGGGTDAVITGGRITNWFYQQATIVSGTYVPATGLITAVTAASHQLVYGQTISSNITSGTAAVVATGIFELLDVTQGQNEPPLTAAKNVTLRYRAARGGTVENIIAPSGYDIPSGIVTLTTDAPHGLSPGDVVTVSSNGSGFLSSLNSEQICVTGTAGTTIIYQAPPNITNKPIVINGGTVVGGPTQTITGGTIGVSTKVWNSGFDNCFMDQIRDIGPCIYGGGVSCYIRRCEITRNIGSGPYIYSDLNSGRSVNCEISGNYIHDNYGAGVGTVLNGTTQSVPHTGIRIFDNYITGNYGGAVFGMCDGLDCTNNRFYANRVQALNVYGSVGEIVVGPHADHVKIVGNSLRDPCVLSTPLLGSAVLQIASGTYDNATGAVVLNMVPPLRSNQAIYTNAYFTLSATTGTGAHASIEGRWIVEQAPTNTIKFHAPSGLGVSTITGGQVTPNGFGIVVHSANQLLIADNFIGDYQATKTMLAAIGGTWGPGGICTGNYYGPRINTGGVGANFPADMSVGAKEGNNFDTVTGFIDGTTLRQPFTADVNERFAPLGIQVGYNRSGGRGESNIYVGAANAKPGGFDFIKIIGLALSTTTPGYVSTIATVAASGNTYNNVTGSVTLTTTTAHGMVVGNLVGLSGVTGTVTSPDGTIGDITDFNGTWTITAVTGTTLTFTVPTDEGAVTITGGTVGTAIVTLATTTPHGLVVGSRFNLSLVLGTTVAFGGPTNLGDIQALDGNWIATGDNTGTSGTTINFNLLHQVAGIGQMPNTGLDITAINGGAINASEMDSGIIDTSVGLPVAVSNSGTLGVTTGGSLLSVDGYANTRLSGALVHGAIKTATLVNGGTVTVPQNTSFMLVNNSSSIATGSLVLPAPAASSFQTIGSQLDVRFQNPVGTLTVTAATGAAVAGPPTTVLSGGASFRFIQGGPGAAANTWLPCIPDVSGTALPGGPFLPLTGGTVTGNFTANANLRVNGLCGFNNTAPLAKPTGWGSSTGGARAAITASSTLPQVAAGLAQLLNDLTAYGLIGV